MAYYDLPLAELRAYRPDLPEPADLDAFWARTLAEARSHDLAATFAPVDNGLALVDTLDVTFAGFNGSPIRGWLHLPAGAQGPLPAVVEYVGYGGGRGLPHERFLWAAAGYAHFVMDTRGQGANWTVGETADPDSVRSPSQPGSMTDGILDPDTYYYRRLFTDAVRAIEAARAHPAVDASRIAVTGISQGGGVTLAVAALVPDLAAVSPDVPFLCNYPRGTTVTDAKPYGEIVAYLKMHRDQVKTVFRTLSYFDGAILSRRSNAPAMFSVALMDMTCPPSTVYAAYNAYAGPKEIREYEFNDHEGGQAFQDVERFAFFARHLGAAPHR